MRDEFRRLRAAKMMSPAQLADRAQAEFARRQGDSIYSPTVLADKIDEVVLGLLDTEYDLYLAAERDVNASLLADYLKGQVSGAPGDIRSGDIEKFILDHFEDIDTFFLGLSQSRRARAGGSFERHLEFILRKLKLPFERQKIIDGTPDFLLPNAALYFKSPSDVILLTAKRTLRERWRQIIIEGRRTGRYFLATIDDGQSAIAVAEMAQERVTLVIPQKIIESRDHYVAAPNVISFNTLLTAFISPTSSRWP